MPEIDGEWVDHEDLEVRVTEAWIRVLKKMRDAGDALEGLIDAAGKTTAAVNLVQNEFDAMGPLLDALQEDESDEYGRGDVEDMEG